MYFSCKISHRCIFIILILFRSLWTERSGQSGEVTREICWVPQTRSDPPWLEEPTAVCTPSHASHRAQIRLYVIQQIRQQLPPGLAIRGGPTTSRGDSGLWILSGLFANFYKQLAWICKTKLTTYLQNICNFKKCILWIWALLAIWS